MNGVRINESYGDVVNWDLIPPSAINTAQIVTGNRSSASMRSPARWSFK